MIFWRQFVWFVWSLMKGSLLKVGLEVSKDLLALAQKYVAEVAPRTDMTGEQKRAWVADQLRSHAIQTGVPIADSVINLLIEIALQGHKAKS